MVQLVLLLRAILVMVLPSLGLLPLGLALDHASSPSLGSLPFLSITSNCQTASPPYEDVWSMAECAEA